ncbi:ABC transporter ATP-binding protein [Brevibacterium sp.]|uniref:ABC transporter ATP-binding protein n=1 Tax=Brevibacterium sp. TaxID=1701 RepID=UPI0025C49764|nr:ABC transporter ATP-binding protein [Brevibacterium sp.]
MNRREDAVSPNSCRLLDVQGLSVAFTTKRGEVTAVEDASLHIDRGQTVALVGQSGSGKSTLASVINHLLASNGRVTAGSVEFDGADLLDLSEQQMCAVRGRQIGLVPQDPMSNLNPLRSIGSQIAEVFTIHGVAKGQEAKRRSIELLDLVGIGEAPRRFRQYPHEFSGGMRQRVLIAMALACRPKLLIADEPTSALDVTVQKRILGELASLTESMGTSVLLVTHDLGLAAEWADEVVVMNRGHVVERGDARTVLTAPSDEYTKRLIAAAPSLAARSLTSEASREDPDAVGGEPGEDGNMSDHIAEVSELTKTYAVRTGLFARSSAFAAVDDVSFAVPRGQTVGIVGESGSGKSTTAKLLLQLEGVSSGSITFDGRDATSLSGGDLFSFRRRVQPVFQNPYASLDPRYTIGDAIREPLDVHGIGDPSDRNERVAALLEQVALDPAHADRYPHELSGGQRQRVAIARALSLEPELVILDEAVSALDVLVQAQILDLLVDLQKRLGLSYVFISHDLAVVRMISHRVHVMRAGKIVESGTPGEIFDHPQHEYTRSLIAAIPSGSSDHSGP